MSRHEPTHAAPTRRHVLACGAGAIALACGATESSRDSARTADENARIDDELADLSDQSDSVEPIRPGERAERRVRAGRLLASMGLDAILMEGGGTLTYLADMHWGKSERLFAMILLADGTHFWICPAFEASRARLSIDAPDGPRGEILAWQEHEHPYQPLASALRERKVSRLAIEPGLRHGFVHELGGALEGGTIASGRAFVVALRAQKDPHELEILRRANELTQQAIAAVSKTLVPGLSGADIGRRMDRAHRRLGFSSPWNLSLIGAAAALPHGDPDAHPLERGDVVLIDTGGSFHGYQSDITRTWVFDGTPAGTVLSAWHAVRDAQQRAFDALRPGRACREIDAVARARIDELGYGPGYRTFTHRLGHGIGVEGHEDPYFDGGSAVVLAPGMTLSNEPGIYLPGEFGVRIEDIVAITPDGADHFGDWQRSPSSPE